MPIQTVPAETVFQDLLEQPFLTAILPTRDEIRGVAHSVVAMTDYFHERGYPFEVLVVDGASRDGTGVLVDELTRRAQRKIGCIRFLPNGRREGPGAGVAEGMRRAIGKYVVIARPWTQHAWDRGARANIRDVEPLIRQIDQGFDIALGEHFTVMRRQVAETLAPRVQIRDAAWLVEILRLARRVGFRVKKLVQPRNDAGPLRNFRARIQIRLHELRGDYRLDEVVLPTEARQSTRLSTVRGQ